MSKTANRAEPSRSSRREFLKTSPAAASAALAGQLNVTRSAHAAGSDLIKIALIGCGGRGRGAARDALRNTATPNVKLVALADAFEDRAENCLESLTKMFPDQVDVPKERVFAGFNGYQSAIDCDVDLVLLVTPPGFRPMQFEAAVAAGRHVFMEKPVAVDAPGVRRVLAANEEAKKKGLAVAVGLNMRHTVGIREVANRVRDGILGRLTFLRAYCNNAGVWVRPREPGQTEMEYQMRNWYYFNWLCGDHIVEQHVHNLDVSNWVMGGHPVEANGMGGREVRKGKDHGQIFDHHCVEFTYADGRKMFSQCRHIPGCWNTVSEFAHGAKGAGNVATHAHGPNPYDQEHKDLIDAIRKNEKYNEGWFGATSSMTAVLGRMATYSGKVVRWDDAVKQGPAEMIYENHDQLTMQSTPPVVPDADGNYPVPVPGVYKPY